MNHLASYDNFSILTRENKTFLLELKKNLLIMRDQPSLNRNITSALLYHRHCDIGTVVSSALLHRHCCIIGIVTSALLYYRHCYIGTVVLSALLHRHCCIIGIVTSALMYLTGASSEIFVRILFIFNSCCVVLIEWTFNYFIICKCMSSNVRHNVTVQFTFFLIMILNITNVTNCDSLIISLKMDWRNTSETSLR